MTHHSGQTILEILITAAIIALLMVGLLNLGTHSLKSSTYAKNLNQATELSNQLADWLRNQKQLLGWQALLDILTADTTDNTVTYCLNDLPNTTAAFQALTNSPCSSDSYIANTYFQRQAVFDLSQTSQGSLAITITTSWQENQTYQAELQIKLTQWN